MRVLRWLVALVLISGVALLAVGLRGDVGLLAAGALAVGLSLAWLVPLPTTQSYQVRALDALGVGVSWWQHHPEMAGETVSDRLTYLAGSRIWETAVAHGTTAVGTLHSEQIPRHLAPPEEWVAWDTAVEAVLADPRRSAEVTVGRYQGDGLAGARPVIASWTAAWRAPGGCTVLVILTLSAGPILEWALADRLRSRSARRSNHRG